MSTCGAPPPILVNTAPSAPSAWATSPAAMERRAHALRLGRLRHGDDDAREPQRAAVLRVERADHRMVLGRPRGDAAAHEAAQHGAVEHFVGMHDRRQHAPHRIAVEDALVEAGRAAGASGSGRRRPRAADARARPARAARAAASNTSTRSGSASRAARARCTAAFSAARRMAARYSERPVPGDGHAEITRLCVRAERRQRGGGPGHVDHGQRADVVHLLIGRHDRHAGQRQRPPVAGAGHAHPARRGNPRRLSLGPRRDHVEHAADAAPLARMHEIEPDLGRAAHRRPAARGARRDRPPGAGPPGAWRSRRAAP